MIWVQLIWYVVWDQELVFTQFEHSTQTNVSRVIQWV